jgi:glutamate 5-kinase
MNTILIKIGSNTLLDEKNNLHTAVIVNVAENVDYILKQWYKVILISSWAVAAGKSKIGYEPTKKVDTVTYKQMCSAVGQIELMKAYMDSFAVYKRVVAQALVTQDTFRIESQTRSFVHVVQSLMDNWVITVINENDVLSSEELVFSDNDSLAEKVGILLWVTKVIILSNIAWLFDAHPEKGGQIIERVSKVDERVYAFVDDQKSSHWRGGMKSKIDTAKALMQAGIPMQIANGQKRDVLRKIIDGEKVWTEFVNATY